MHVPDSVDEQGRRTIDLLEAHYRSGHDDLGKAFFIPCLRHCSRYRRAVGFFSSSSFVTWAEILPALVRSDCPTTIQLLLSPVLSAQDRATLLSVETEDQRAKIRQALGDKIIEDALAFAESSGGDSSTRHRLLAWMIASGKLEVRFAFARHVEAAGLFHEKIGVFEFPWGSRVAFTGSANETLAGYSNNYETIDVFRDWIAEDSPRVRVKEEQFTEAWDGSAPGLIVLGLSPEVMSRIKERSEEFAPRGTATDVSANIFYRWRHQDEAIAIFLQKQRGILEMATGTGKTRTALSIVNRLVRGHFIETVIIAADGNDLLDQWHGHLLPLASSLGFTVTRRYRDIDEFSFFALGPKSRFHLCSRQRLPQALRALPPLIKQRSLLIHDEVHRLGSPGNRTSLSGLEKGLGFCLGLSATPEREYDQDGNAFIQQHIGPVIYRFPLETAIARGILAPFNYYPLEWEANDDDRQQIAQVYKQVAARKASGDPMSQEEVWTRLASVYKTSPSKLPAFRDFLHRNPELLKGSIIFVATEAYAAHIIPQIHDITLRFHIYFAGEKTDVLRRFARQDLDCLITCHRLSEGLDIRSLSSVFLLSADRAKLETIQRIGRCLRVDPSNPAKRANIVDFIRISDDPLADPTADMERRKWLRMVAAVKPR